LHIAGKSSTSGGTQSAQTGIIAGGANIFNSVTKGAMSVTKGAANLTFKAAATAVSAAKTLAVLPREDSTAGISQQGLISSTRAKPKVPHVVACVSTTSSKAVAAAFFGPPAAGQALGAGAAAAAAATGAVAGVDVVAGGVVGSRLFTYELLVPGEIEGAVLVQVANEPHYVKVRSRLIQWLWGWVCFSRLISRALAFSNNARGAGTHCDVVAVGKVAFCPQHQVPCVEAFLMSSSTIPNIAGRVPFGQHHNL
jgi:hypothetical protein